MRNKFAVSVYILMCILVTDLFSQDTSYNLTTGALQAGSLTEGFFETNIKNLTKVRVNFFENSYHSIEKVPETDLSTQYNEKSRREIDILFPVSFIPFLQSTYLGLNIVNIREESTATFVMIDDIGEFGTDYYNSRETTFFSPRIALSFERNSERNDSSINLFGLTYNALISPFYFFLIDQDMFFNYTDHKDALDPIQLTNSITRFASPYIKHSLTLGFSSIVQFEIQHSYQFLPYKTIQLTSLEDDLIIIDDPTHINMLRIAGDFIISLGGDFSINAGIGYDWNWMHRTSGEIDDIEKKTIVGIPYLRIGSSLL